MFLLEYTRKILGCIPLALKEKDFFFSLVFPRLEEYAYGTLMAHLWHTYGTLINLINHIFMLLAHLHT